jgi:hypothetical protein
MISVRVRGTRQTDTGTAAAAVLPGADRLLRPSPNSHPVRLSGSAFNRRRYGEHIMNRCSAKIAAESDHLMPPYLGQPTGRVRIARHRPRIGAIVHCLKDRSGH